jgi:hypothetical protein
LHLAQRGQLVQRVHERVERPLCGDLRERARQVQHELTALATQARFEPLPQAR